MDKLANLIGLDNIVAVVDDFFRAAAQHPLLAPWLARAADLERYRQRLVAFWYAALDGESYRLARPTSQLPALIDDIDRHHWHSIETLLHHAIDRHVPGDLARHWHRRLDQLGETVPA
ncbi:hypothetical protein N8I74_01225 [Chitiniphilus purpureus]|uniref:Group III truncated hemoglobin n=1 Tax=Chitiniphilus purpureus TaxID=2981137 RepID=A0ABY6DMT5_9NEIS|nr:hypothetical protein [Chitiniphilus sp. CD1]UXY15664.1 hypothetical protein N8I74_01225 [Chitiniphilus sp. CD1]